MPDWARFLVAGLAIVVMIGLLWRVGLAGVFLGLEESGPPRPRDSGQRTIVMAVLAIVAVILLVWLVSGVLSR